MTQGDNEHTAALNVNAPAFVPGGTTTSNCLGLVDPSERVKEEICQVVAFPVGGHFDVDLLVLFLDNSLYGNDWYTCDAITPSISKVYRQMADLVGYQIFHTF